MQVASYGGKGKGQRLKVKGERGKGKGGKSLTFHFSPLSSPLNGIDFDQQPEPPHITIL